MLHLTERAAEALRVAAAAAHRFDPDARIRLRRAEGGVVVELTHGPSTGETDLHVDGVDLIVTEGLTGTVDATDHNAFTLGP